MTPTCPRAQHVDGNMIPTANKSITLKDFAVSAHGVTSSLGVTSFQEGSNARSIMLSVNDSS